MMGHTVVVGTRTSRLARWQTDFVVKKLKKAWVGDLEVEVRACQTAGDRAPDAPLETIGELGVFTGELERALMHGEIDVAVHSLKDLPVDSSPNKLRGFVIHRGDPREALVSRKGLKLARLPSGARVGTSSPRRAAQLMRLRPDVEPVSIRGNVDTRVRKVESGDYDAAVLAAVGLERLDLNGSIAQYFTLDEILPAPGQAALLAQCRASDRDTVVALAAIEDATVRATTTAERQFLGALGTGCSSPVAAHAVMQGESIELTGAVTSTDGKTRLKLSAFGADPVALGCDLAERVLRQSATNNLEL